jgi:hypothetical protein
MSKVENWKDIPLSEAGKQFIKELEPGVCVIVRAKHVNNIKSKLPRIQIEFAEKLNINGDNAVSAISLLNSDFSRGAQRCWVTATLAEAKALIGVEVPEDESFVEVLKPCPEYKGNKVFRLQYSEILESQFTDNMNEYPENNLKRAGAEGNYFYAKNPRTGQLERVGSVKELVIVDKNIEPTMKTLEGEYLPEGENINAVLGPAQGATHSDVQMAGS